MTPFSLAGCAVAKKFQLDADDFKATFLSEFANRIDWRNLDNLAAVKADQVIVLIYPDLVVLVILPQFARLYKPQLFEEAYRPVDRGEVDLWIFPLGELLDLARVEVGILTDDAKEELPLGGDPLPRRPQELHRLWNVH